MALFGGKKGGSKGSGDDGKDGDNGVPDDIKPAKDAWAPDKAADFYQYAKTVEDTGNLEYALQNWLKGLGHDPSNFDAMEKAVNIAARLSNNGKNRISKEVTKPLSAKSAPERFAMALLDWGRQPTDALAAVRAAEFASKLELDEQAYWIGERALKLALGEAKQRKDLLVKLMGVFEKLHAFGLAVAAGDAAVKLDPSDQALNQEVRNLSAQSAMTGGGFDETGQEGGFRKNIRDADAQRKLIESEQISKSQDTVDRLIGEARADYETRPDDPAVINVYGKRLVDRGTNQDLAVARELFKKAYQKTNQFRFRQEAGRVHLVLARRKLDEYKAKAEAPDASDEAKANYGQAKQKYAQLNLGELKAAEANYPTDLGIKYRLAQCYVETGDHSGAIPLLQKAASDAKVRARSLSLLAECFLAESFIDEAIDAYRRGIEAHTVTSDDLGMSLRYGLMAALEAKAQEDRDIDAAREAETVASKIAGEQFDYRDIPARKKALKALVGELRGTS